ncbi:uncharacterized protein LOC131251953 [Magnolia sinica]|uniref:uncharacterized protein LOC131251953 n=1 Tax=Magnolia sinica TaxID=86752 RepID=UPI002658A095|nr:uncharacterized protein LOC131251953 [Magnolia sinica]
MDQRRESNGLMSVPQFGGWDQKVGDATDYSMIFSRARENKKQRKKTDFNPSNGNEEQHTVVPPQQQDSPSSVQRKKRILSYFKCCIKPIDLPNQNH